jgi:hypothetical protein
MITKNFLVRHYNTQEERNSIQHLINAGFEDILNNYSEEYL